MYILDATAFMDSHEVEGPTATVPRVRDELQDASAYRYDAMEGSGMHIQIPDEAAVDRVRTVAKDTGDGDTLSETDVQLLAGALELDATLVTDDYAMQNVAEHLDVPVEMIAKEGIEEVRDWDFQCQGCGREYDERRERCPICGSDLSRKRPS
jgi:UPF0271 protein